MRTALVEKRVAVTLYKLATCAKYRVVGDVFGIHKSTVHKHLKRVINAILKRITPLTVRMPNLQEAIQVSTERRKGFL